ncbi:hypothetical protein AMECASPLE_038541 [Ameca splendens]|uniref:Uncharacterized protein n=1 Tax=Ameca splendens TaxID=208324 RepID=A0ABV0YWA3_9TELE
MRNSLKYFIVTGCSLVDRFFSAGVEKGRFWEPNKLTGLWPTGSLGAPAAFKDLCGPDGEKVCWFSCKDIAQYIHRSLRTEELSGALQPLFNSDGRLEAAHLLSSVTKNFSRRTIQSQSHQLCRIFTRISFIMILEDLENIAKDPERWVQMTAIQI